MSDLVGNHIVGFSTRRLICLFVFKVYNKISVMSGWSHDFLDITSRIMRKSDFCICENKGADQLRSYFFFLIQFYVPFKIISAHMRQANQ